MKRFLAVFFFSSILCFVGCRRLPEHPEGMPDLVPCRVVVTFGGEKMEGVSVLLQPENTKTNDWPAGGQTNAEGMAIMKTAAYYEGVVPGEYTISFKKYAPEEMRQDGMALPAKSLIPLKYSTGKSKETITVQKGQAEYVFSLDALEENAK